MNEQRFAAELLLSLEKLEELAIEVTQGRRYSIAHIRKRDGSSRTLCKPDLYLSLILKKATEYFRLLPVDTPDHVHGFVRKRSTLTNARAHLNQPAVLRIDISRFFESVTSKRVGTSLETLGFDSGAAALGVQLMTVEGCLPTGFSTSPFLSNVAFNETDQKLRALADEAGVNFTRYVDDLTFSGDCDEDLVGAVTAVLEQDGWAVNAAKTSIMKRGGKQYVTGLTVSDSKYPRIPVRFKRMMRWKIYYIERFGYDTYMSQFGGEDLNDHPRKLLGYARYMAAIEPAVGLDLLQRFNAQFDDSWYHRDDEDEEYWRNWLDDFWWVPAPGPASVTGGRAAGSERRSPLGPPATLTRGRPAER